MSLTRIGSIGINTGIAFAGVTTIVTLNTANDALSIGATVNVGSGITLGASGDIFATGVSTVTTLKVGSGVTVSSDGDVFFTGIATGNGSGLTALNASNISSGTVPTARLGSGTASSSTFLRGDSTFQTVNTDLVSDTSPQLGGNLDVNTKNIVFGDSSDGTSDDVLKFGAGTDLLIYSDGSTSIMKADDLRIRTTANENYINCTANGSVELYHDNSKKFETASYGVLSAGQVRVSSSNATTVAFSVGDEGTGFYNTGSNAIGYASQGTQKWNINSSGNLRLNDSVSAQFGTGSDLLIYHDGNSKIQNSNNSCDFRIQSDSIELKANSVDEYMFKGTVNGAVELYHDNDLKLQTHATGFNLQGGSNNISVNLETTDGTRRGSAYANDSNMVGFLDAGGDWAIQHQNDSHTDFFIQTNRKVRIDADGLKFGTDTAAANALDDYEEGTFTPRLGGTSNSSTYFVSGYGWYRKIGRMVYTCVRFNGVDLDNNASGEVKIFNLPYTVNSAATSTDSVTTDFATFNVVFNTSHQYAWYASNGGTSWVGLESRNNTSWASWYVSDFHSSSLYINFSGWYQTDS